jgi:hypothetical protein
MSLEVVAKKDPLPFCVEKWITRETIADGLANELFIRASVFIELCFHPA